jgi:cell division protein FtsB
VNGEEDIESLRRTNERLRRENQRLNSEIETLNDEIGRLTALVREFETSRSWRLTRPLRRITRRGRTQGSH